MGISLQKIHVNPAAPLYDINVDVVVCHKHNGAICFCQNTNSHQYVINSHIIFEHLSNYKWPYASLQQERANSKHYIQFKTFSSAKSQSTWFVHGRTLKDKVYNNNPHNEDDMKGSIKNVWPSISAKEPQCVKNVFARCVHLPVVHNSKNPILTTKYYTNSLEHF